MSTIRNKIILIGNVCQEPEIKTFEGNKKNASITIATNEYYTDSKGDKVQTSAYHKCIAWGPTADIIEKYIQKGKEIAIEGKLNYRSYIDKDDKKIYITEIIINEIVLLGK